MVRLKGAGQIQKHVTAAISIDKFKKGRTAIAAQAMNETTKRK
jgi:hypothetical protein